MKSNFGKMLLSALLALLGIVAGKPIVELAAGPAVAKISGPTSSPLRQVALLDASESTAQKFTWSIAPAGVPYSVLGDGRFCAIYTGEKPMNVAVRLVVQSARGGKLTDSTLDYALAIGGAPPAPPGPTPPNPPAPVPPGPTPPTPPPDGGFMGLTKITLDAVTSLVPASNSRQGEARAFAKALHDVAKECKPGGQTPTYLEAGAAAIRAKKALGDARHKWEPAIQEVNKHLSAAMTTSTPIGDIGKAIDAIADGLDLVQ